MTRAVAKAVEAITTTVLFIQVGARRLPLKSAVSKPKDDGTGGGNTYWFLSTTEKMPYAGVLLPHLTDDGSLPEKVQLVVQQVEITGTESTVLDEKVVPVPLEGGYTKKADGSPGNVKVSRSGSFDVPFIGPKNLQVTISAPKSEPTCHNVIIKVIGLGGAGGGRKAASFDDLF